jgi:UDP-glucuronate 4-epimerase
VKVTVTGAAGFIGSHVTDALLDAGHEVVGIDCFTGYYRRDLKEANLAVALASPRFELVEADLCSADLDALLAGMDAVVHEAAAPGLEHSEVRAAEYEAINSMATARLGRACVTAGVAHLVHASTSSVYGLEATGAEDGPTQPISIYGTTKLAGEQALLDLAARGGLPLTVLRYYSVYGPRQRPDMAYRRFCEQLLRGEPVTIYGDGSQSRSNTYVSDCVAATLAALDHPPTGAIYNIGGGQELRLLDALAIIAHALGVTAHVTHDAARAGDQVRTSADITRARRDLGWSPLVDPEEGLAREARWVADRRR